MSKYVAVALHKIYLCEDNVLGNVNVKVFDTKEQCREAIDEAANNNEIAKELFFNIIEVNEND